MREFKSANEAWLHTVHGIKTYGNESSPRGHKIKEVKNYSLCISNPRDRIITLPFREMSLPFAFGEFLWYMSGRNDLETMEYYSKKMKDFSDDGLTLNSAYGHRIFGHHEQIGFDQWDNAMETLRKDPDSRQAVIHFHTPNNKPTKDEVCTLTMQLMIRHGALDMIINMRSNDINWGFTYDVFSFTMMQELMANELGVKLGKYYHNAGSMHLYEKDFEMAESEPFKFYFNNRHELPTNNFNLNGLTRYSKELSDLMDFEYECRRGVDYAPDFFNSATSMMADVLDRYYDYKFKVKDRESNDRWKDELKHSNFMHWMLINFFDKKKPRSLSIVEGPDGSGKSTMINIFEGFTDNANIMHFDKPKKYFNLWCYILSVDCNGAILLDRSFISEIVYSKFFKRECRISESLQKFLFTLAKRNGTIELLVGVMDWVDSEDRKWLDRESMPILNYLYAEVMERSNKKVIERNDW